MICNGVSLLDGFVSFPFKQTWSAWLHTSSPMINGSPCKITSEDGAFDCQGTCVLSSEDGPIFRSMVVGGAGKLAQPINPSWHQAETLGSILLAHSQGEAFAPSALLQNQVNTYVASAWIFSDLLDALAPDWWMTDAGLIACDPRVPVLAAIAPGNLIRLDPHGARFRDSQLLLRPGTIFSAFSAQTNAIKQFEITQVRVEWDEDGTTSVNTETKPWT